MKRRSFLSLFLTAAIACFLAIACSATPPAIEAEENGNSPATIAVSAAASLQDALEAIVPSFNAARADIAVEYNFASSGALQQQIEQGAPVDVFFSAAAKQMNALEEKGLILPESRRDLVANSLVLIAPVDSTLEISDLSQLKDVEIDRFAVGEFRSVPAGQYAEQVLKNMDLLAPLESKFVFGNNVRNVLAAVESGDAELGMVYATDAALSDRVKVLATAPEGSHEPIVYPIAIIANSSQPEAASAFIDFLASDEARSTFEEFGFIPS